MASTFVRSAPSWIAYNSVSTNIGVRLFCFPYAGGAANIFRPWVKQLSHVADVYPIQLPGRGDRITEPSLTSTVPMVDALVKNLAPYFDRPFAFFGHSMGALIAFELARKLRSEHGPLPVHIIVSGRRAPHLPRDFPITFDLPDREFEEELKRLGGTGKEVVENPEIMGLMKPTLRADFQLCQEYNYIDQGPLGCPFTVLGGTDDPDVKLEHLAPWKEHTTGECLIKLLPGDHFFIHSASAETLQILSRDLAKFKRIGPRVLSRG